MKKILQLSISLILLLSCGTGIFTLWQNSTKRDEKKAKLDNYYFEKLKSDCRTSNYLTTSGREQSFKAWQVMRYLMEKTEISMLEDGYDRAEIQELEKKAEDAECRIVWAQEAFDKRKAAINAQKSIEQDSSKK